LSNKYYPKQQGKAIQTAKGLHLACMQGLGNLACSFFPSFLAARATWLREFGFLYIQVRQTVGGLDNFDLEAILLQRNSNHSSTHQALTTTSTTGKEINGSLSPITHYDADNLLGNK
jgi:hypothetical protein